MLENKIPRRAKLVKHEVIAPDVRQFWFEIPEVEHFNFLPGQFVSLSEPFNGKKVTRAYSIASCPNGNTFELCLNEVKEGIFSPHLFRMNEGDTVEMKGPHGGFVMRKPVSDSMFIATGTGIAPFIPMAEDSIARHPERNFWLVFGVRHDYAILHQQRFLDLAAKYPNFKVITTVTRPGADWTGNVGRVQQYIFPEIGERRDLDIYICGMKEMVNDVRDRCLALGFDKKQIVYERYD